MKISKITPRLFVKNLVKSYDALENKKNKLDLSGFDVVEAQANIVLSCIQDEIKLAEDTVEGIHEIKGVCAGLKLSHPLIIQHTEIWKNKIDKEEVLIEDGKAAIQAIAGCAQTLKDMYSKKSDELKQLIGRLEGINKSFQMLETKMNKLLDGFTKHDAADEVEKYMDEQMEDMQKVRAQKNKDLKEVKKILKKKSKKDKEKK